MKKRLAIFGVVLAVLGVVLWLLLGRGGDGKGNKTQTAAATGAADGTGGGGGARAARDKKPDPRTLALASFSGTVTEKGAGPVAGAQVCARGWVEDVPQEETRDPKCVTTDAQGRYAIDKLYVGTYRVSASAPQKIPASWQGPKPDKDDSFKLKAGETKPGVDMVLEPGGVEVRGTVGDINGGPIADAWVEVGNGWRWDNQGQATTRSAEDGTFVVWVGPGTIHASAAADGYTAGSAEGRAPTAKLEILLTPESSLSGIVVEAETGKPVAEASVWIQPDWSQGDAGDGGWAISDAEGKWRIERLGPGRYKPTAQALGKFGEPASSVLLGLGESVDGIVIPLHAVQVVTGRVVVDDGSGELKGCKDASVWGQGKTGRYISGSADEDDAEGTIRMEAVPPGTYEIQVWCEGYTAEPEYPDLVVETEDVTGLEWKVHAGGTVVGTIKTKAGTPVAKANVTGRTIGGDPRGARSWARDRSEDDGSYTLTGVVPGEVQVEASHGDYPAPDPAPKTTVVAGQEARLDIVLEDGGAIAGIVVDEDGTPVRGAQIQAWGDKWTRRWNWDSNPTSGDDGRFEIKGLEAGSYRVQASFGWTDQMRKPGSNDDDVQGERVTVSVGQSAEVRLVVESRKGVIAGVVVDATGKPISDAYLAVERESDVEGMPSGAAARSSRWSWDRKPVVTDPAGGFEIKELSPGKYTVRAYRRGGGEAIAEHVAIGTKNARLVIKATGSIAGTVTIKGGGTIEDLTVAIEDQQTGFQRTEQFFRTSGAFTLAELPAGKFKLTAAATAGSGELELSLTEGENKAGVAIELEARTTVKGRVVALSDGKPIPGIQVMVQPQSGSDGIVINGGGGTQHISDAEGRFVVEDAPSGKVQIIGFPVDWDESKYSFVRIPRTLKGGGGELDIGDLKMMERRAGAREMGGDFGMEFKQYGPEVPEEEQKLEIRRVKPGSAAEKVGVTVGDTVIAIDGHDVTGENKYLAWSLMHVSVGTKVTFGFSSGATHEIVAEKPE